MVFALTNAYYLSGLGFTARIFAIIGGILFVSGLILLVLNRQLSEKRPHGIIDTVVKLLVFMATSTVIVLIILALTLGDVAIYP